jgi:predicted CxxxxCH...CXXCH cytochrome family protein
VTCSSADCHSLTQPQLAQAERAWDEGKAAAEELTILTGAGTTRVQSAIYEEEIVPSSKPVRA